MYLALEVGGTSWVLAVGDSGDASRIDARSFQLTTLSIGLLNTGLILFRLAMAALASGGSISSREQAVSVRDQSVPD